MTDQEKRQLDIKLAKYFLNVKRVYYDEEWDAEHHNPMYIPSGKPWRTHEIDSRPIPRFTEYLDACIVLIMPRLFTWSLGKNWEIQGDFTMKANGFKASVDLLPVDPDKWDEVEAIEAISETPPLAFCLAVEKALDKEEHGKG